MSISGGLIFNYQGFWLVFLTSATFNAFVVFYCLARVRNDSVIHSGLNEMKNKYPSRFKRLYETETPKHRIVRSLIDFFKKLYMACFRKRQGSLTAIMVLLICSKMLGVVADSMVQYNILFLYIEEKFGWSVEQFSIWSGIYYLFVCVGLSMIAPIFDRLLSNPLQSYVANLLCGSYYFVIAMANPNRR